MGCQVQKAMLPSLLANLGRGGFRLRQFQHLSVGKSIVVEFSNAFDFLSRAGQQRETLANSSRRTDNRGPSAAIGGSVGCG